MTTARVAVLPLKSKVSQSRPVQRHHLNPSSNAQCRSQRVSTARVRLSEEDHVEVPNARADDRDLVS